MTDQIVLRDVARIILPFCIFIGFFSHGLLSDAGLALGMLCIGYEMKQRKQALTVNEAERA
jgi:hypothetical protein